MIIYNVTWKVDWSIHDEWVAWMKDYHIPKVLGTGCFVKNNFARLLEVEEEDGPTYSLQYYADTRADYQRYIEEYAPAFREENVRKWGDRFIAFRSLMEVVQ